MLGKEKLQLDQLRIPGAERLLYFKHEERPVLVQPSKLVLGRTQPDELNRGLGKLNVAFTLPPGSYATLVVKRLFHATHREDSPEEIRALPATAGRPGGATWPPRSPVGRRATRRPATRLRLATADAARPDAVTGEADPQPPLPAPPRPRPGSGPAQRPENRPRWHAPVRGSGRVRAARAGLAGANVRRIPSRGGAMAQAGRAYGWT